jgi:hypothetical protein
MLGLLVDVAEVACGDPSCAPIDTVFTLVWQSGGKGVFALPMLASEVTKEDLIDSFPVGRCARRNESAKASDAYSAPITV